MGGTTAEFTNGEVSASRNSDVNGVFVFRFNSAGALANAPFHLAVFC